MSEIIVDTLESDNGSISFGDSSIAGGLVLPGSVVNFAYVEEDGRLSVAANNNSWNILSQLDITIARTVPGSSFQCVWMVNGEATGHDHMFTVYRLSYSDLGNGTLIGYNTDAGAERWSGVSHGWYDRDQNSTQYNNSIVWYDAAPSDASFPVGTEIVYRVGNRSSNNANYTYWLNRTDSRGGQNAYENTVSAGYVMEIAP